MTPLFEVYAVKLGSVERAVRDNFLYPVDDAGSMVLDFHLWVLRCQNWVGVVDTGFSDEAGRRRGRHLDVSPSEALAALGIEPDEVDDLIVTHLHYDHAGNLGAFPSAQIHIQEAEIAYATGRHMQVEELRKFYEADDIAQLVRELHRGRVTAHTASVELRPGLVLEAVGGHTDGLQVVRVHTARGWVVLAADALHYTRNLRTRNPFPSVFDVDALLAGYEAISDWAQSPDHIVPGHDPEVMLRYPNVEASGVTIAALHLPPFVTTSVET